MHDMLPFEDLKIEGKGLCCVFNVTLESSNPFFSFIKFIYTIKELGSSLRLIMKTVFLLVPKGNHFQQFKQILLVFASR